MFSILVADDSYENRLALIRYIQKIDSDFNVCFEAVDGQEALNFIKTNPVDAVFADIKMPNKSGLELLDDIKKLNGDLDVVLVSSYTEFNYAKEGLVLGAFDYIVKPLNKTILSKVLARLKISIKKKLELKNTLLNKFDPIYLNKNVSIILDLANTNMEDSLSYTINILENLYSTYDKDFDKLICITDMFVNMFIFKLKEKYPWIFNYRCFHIENIKGLTHNHDKDYLFSEVIKLINDFSCTMSALKLNQSDSIVKQVCEYVAKNSDAKLTLNSTAEEFNFTPNYLGRLFKLKTGENFINYVNRIKMERAKYLLSLHKFKNYEIATILCYKDIDYFSEQFNKYIGESPSSYKNRNIP